jgi:hypothetical protein
MSTSAPASGSTPSALASDRSGLVQTLSSFILFNEFTEILHLISKVKSSMAAPLSGGISGCVVLAGILICILLCRRRKRTKRQENCSYHPQPFNTVQVDRLLDSLPVIRDSLRKQQGGRSGEGQNNSSST